MSDFEKETIRVYGKTYELEIARTDWADSPLEGDFYKLVTAHRNYRFEGLQLPSQCNSIDAAFDEYLDNLGLSRLSVIYQEVYIYDHSGLAISTTPFSCRWDSGQVGFIYVTKKDVRRNYNVKHISPKLYKQVVDNMGDILRNEYQSYLNGEYYGFNCEELDISCGGFLGSDHERSGLLEYACEDAKYMIKHRAKKHFEYLKKVIMNKVGLSHRKPLIL